MLVVFCHSFLVSAQQEDVVRIGTILKKINDERKLVEQGIYQDILSGIRNNTIDLAQESVIMAASASWPAGVIGLVAGKIMHQFGRPTILLHADHQAGVFKGS